MLSPAQRANRRDRTLQMPVAFMIKGNSLAVRRLPSVCSENFTFHRTKKAKIHNLSMVELHSIGKFNTRRIFVSNRPYQCFRVSSIEKLPHLTANLNHTKTVRFPLELSEKDNGADMRILHGHRDI